MNMDSDSQKLRNAGIIYKNRKYYINDNLDIPFIINNNSKDNDLDKNFILIIILMKIQKKIIMI